MERVGIRTRKRTTVSTGDEPAERDGEFEGGHVRKHPAADELEGVRYRLGRPGRGAKEQRRTRRAIRKCSVCR